MEVDAETSEVQCCYRSLSEAAFELGISKSTMSSYVYKKPLPLVNGRKYLYVKIKFTNGTKMVATEPNAPESAGIAGAISS